MVKATISIAHQARCQQFLQSPHIKGWDSIFVRTIARQKAITRRDSEILAGIEAKLGGVE